MIDGYDWAGGREAMLRFGPADARDTVVVALPLLEEANRTRQLAAAILRALAERGIAGALPDLPGTGDSLVATRDMTLGHLRTAFAAAAASLPGRVWTLAIRSGALLDLDATVAGRWLLAPQGGDDLLRDWRRIGAAGLREGEDDGSVAGNIVSDALRTALAGADPARADVPTRTVRLDTDPRPADLKLPGTPLWRASEPRGDPALAQAAADDIARWIACAA